MDNFIRYIIGNTMALKTEALAVAVQTVACHHHLNHRNFQAIPKEIRDGLGLKPGDRATFTLMPGGTAALQNLIGQPSACPRLPSSGLPGKPPATAG
jgi:AbrB family looped-hinge helix DNA binding protein